MDAESPYMSHLDSPLPLQGELPKAEGVPLPIGRPV